MHPANLSGLFVLFGVVWQLLLLFSAGFFFVNKNATLKRMIWPWFVIGAGLLFLGLVGSVGGYKVLFVAGPTVALLAISNLRLVKFCDSCGNTIRTASKFCSQCGAELKRARRSSKFPPKFVLERTFPVSRDTGT